MYVLFRKTVFFSLQAVPCKFDLNLGFFSHVPVSMVSGSTGAQLTMIASPALHCLA